MSHVERFDADEAKAVEFMRRFSDLVLLAVDGTWEDGDGTLGDLEEELHMTKAEAVAILERRMRPN